MITRKPDWEQRLNDYLADVQAKAHDYGKHDCALGWARAVKAMTGTDLARGWYGKYSDEAGAQEALKAAGFANLAELVESKLPHKSRAMAQRGDVVMTRDGNLAMVYGEVALGIGEDTVTGRVGLIRVPRDQWVRAWGVGG